MTKKTIAYAAALLLVLLTWAALTGYIDSNPGLPLSQKPGYTASNDSIGYWMPSELPPKTNCPKGNAK